jgi:hypothetical protein
MLSTSSFSFTTISNLSSTTSLFFRASSTLPSTSFFFCSDVSYFFCNWDHLFPIHSNSLCSSSPLFLISCTIPACNSCNYCMEIHEMTIFKWPSAFICSCNSPTIKSSVSISICRILCPSVSGVKADYTISACLLGPIDGSFLDLCCFIRFATSIIC